MKWLNGRKTAIGTALGGLLSLIFGLDLVLHDDVATDALDLAWLSEATYLALAGWLIAWTGGVGITHKLLKANGK